LIFRKSSIEARAPSAGRIYLFGEHHGETRQLDKEFELWRDFYAGGMRRLFVELPYFAAEFLNEWMREDGDGILEALFDDAKGTAGDTPQNMGFYRRIKAELPETVPHVRAVGHAHETTGARFLERLRESGQEPSERHSLAVESVEQGRLFYGALGRSLSAREGMMTSNFVRAFDDLNGESAMGIYGDAHVAFDGDKTHAIGATMAARLRERYGDSLSAAQLRDLLPALEPLRLDALTVDGTELKAAYFGEHAGHREARVLADRGRLRALQGPSQDRRHPAVWQLSHAGGA